MGIAIKEWLPVTGVCVFPCGFFLAGTTPLDPGLTEGVEV